MASRYSFRDRWFVGAPVEQVHAALIDLERYPEWWPQVVAVAKAGEEDAVVLCRSALPYTLELEVHAVSRALPRIEVALDGHLRGYVRWTLTAAGADAGPGTCLSWEQQVSVHGWLAPLSALGRPLLGWNHARMMAGGRAGLRSRLEAGADRR